jgi:hypothetical protein
MATMPPRRSRLRRAIDAIVADGQPHTVEELSGRIIGLVILPGTAAREAERQRRRKGGPPERVRKVTADHLIAVGRRRLIRRTLDAMVTTGAVRRIAPSTYQLSGFRSPADRDPDEGSLAG